MADRGTNFSGRNQTGPLKAEGKIGLNTFTLTFFVLANADMATQSFWIADGAYEVVAVRENHDTAGSNGGAVTLDVTKDSDTEAAGAGQSVLAATINLKATVKTTQSGTVNATAANRKLTAGQRLSAKFTGTLTALAGLVLTVTLKRTS